MNQLRPRRPVALIRLARLFSMTLPKLLNFVRYHQIPTKILDGLVTMGRPDAVKILKWNRSCGVSKAARELRIRDSAPKRLLKQRRLKGETLFGKMRITKKSIALLKKKGVHDKSVVFPDRQGFARFSKRRLREISRRAGKTPRKKPIQRRSKEEVEKNREILAAKKVERERRKKEREKVDLDGACRIMGMLGWEVIKMYADGRLPGEIVDGNYRFSKQNVESHAMIYNRPTALHRKAG